MINNDKAKLRWRSCRRGMLEVELFLMSYVDHVLASSSASVLQTFTRLLEYPDPQLLAWFMGYEQPDDAALRDICQSIRDHNAQQTALL